MASFSAGNYAMPTTAAPTPVTTGTAIRTHLQIATATSRGIKPWKWGVEFATPPTVPVTCELFGTSVAASVGTAHTAPGVMAYNPSGVSGTQPVSTVQLGAALTGFTFTTENTVANYRMADLRIIPAGVSECTWEWSLGREFEVPPSSFLRVRMTTATAVSMLTYVIWDE